MGSGYCYVCKHIAIGHQPLWLVSFTMGLTHKKGVNYMTEYTKMHKSGLYIAKRGYCYFAYKSLEQAQEDDVQVSRNLKRLQNGE